VLATQTKDFLVTLLRAASGERLRDIAVEYVPGHLDLSFSADSELLAVSNLHDRLAVVRVADGVESKDLPARGLFARFSTTGGRMAAVTPGQAAVWVACGLPGI
jgi:hypothetical protein